jgi:hypothetical protein
MGRKGWADHTSLAEKMNQDKGKPQTIDSSPSGDRFRQGAAVA